MPSRHHFPRLLPWISSLAVAAAVGYSLAPGPASRPASHTPVSPALAALTRPLAATAGDPIFLNVAGVTGEATDKLHPNWIELQGYSWGVSNPGGTAGSGAGKAAFSPIAVRMALSKATPPLISDVATGRRVATAVIQAARTIGPSEANYLTITLSNVTVSGVSEGASSGGTIPAESMSLSYSKIAISYTQYGPTGKKVNTYAVCWDVAANSSCPTSPAS
jgi:type VI secretion system secreted protein Hcp